MRLAALAVVTLIAAATHWSYTGKDGPTHWAELSPKFGECAAGARQSPIDIRNAAAADLHPLELRYEPVPLRAVNNGHTIRVDVPKGSRLIVGAHTYRLVQVHFHAPSEEAVDGRRHALVAHLVHEDSAGNVAVVAVLFDVGRENASLRTLFDALPPEPGSERVVHGETIHLDELLPPKMGYYEYQGSLTTPPCSEGVRWFVLKQPVSLSAQQLAEFRALYPNNARPLQPANGRLVRQSAR
jgi:carbonic anhydrase